MIKLAFILNSNVIHTYLFNCIDYLSKDINDISIEIFVDKTIKNKSYTFPPFIKFIDSKFNNFRTNALDFKDINELFNRTNITCVDDLDSLNYYDFIIFEQKQTIQDSYKKLARNGILTLDFNIETIIYSTLNLRRIPLRILFYNNTKEQWNVVLEVELKKENGIINNSNKLLLNYSVFLSKILKNLKSYRLLSKPPILNSLGLRLKFKLLIYYINLVFVLITRKLNWKKLNWKLVIKDKNKIVFLNQPKASFWADPFVIKQKNESIIYFEELKQNKIGRISSVRLNENHQIIEKKIIIDEEYHLSFPNVFLKDNKYYMIPESSASNFLKLYLCEEFPYKWKFKMNLMENIKLLDAIWLYYDNLYWIFANKIEDFEYENNEKLYIYFADELFSNNWTPHKCNPIITDSSKARNAGNFIFKNSKIYRVSQSCTSGYGEKIVINEIKELTKDKYIEVTVNELNPPNNFVGMHTMNNDNGLEVFDVLKKE